MLRMLDLDLDFFVHGVAFHRGRCIRGRGKRWVASAQGSSERLSR